jgi:hypothetical protein
MAVKPLKRTGFQQGVFAESSSKKEEVGTLRILRDGRKFRYAKAGASALAAGKINTAPDVAAAVMNETVTAAWAIGAMTITETVTAPGSDVAEDFYAGGYLQVNDVTGEGHQYKIQHSTAVAAAGTSITLHLTESIRVATTTSSQFTIVANPQMAVVETATKNKLVTGVCPMVVTAAYYFWNQTGGPALVLAGDTAAVGDPLMHDSLVAGAVTGTDDASYYQCIGYAMGTVHVATEYKPVWLCID